MNWELLIILALIVIIVAIILIFAITSSFSSNNYKSSSTKGTNYGLIVVAVTLGIIFAVFICIAIINWLHPQLVLTGEVHFSPIG